MISVRQSAAAPARGRLLAMVAAALLAVSCGVSNQVPRTRESLYPAMYEEKPLVLLVMPPINNTTNVDAKDLLYTSISRPLADAGYYVISPLLALDVLKAESAYDAELFENASLAPFRKYFGADAVVFSQIDSWEKGALGISTKIRYFIRSAISGEVLFDRTCDLFLDCSVSSNSNTVIGLLVDLAASAISTALTDHIEAARMANHYVFEDIPRGKYNPEYQQDRSVLADEPCVTASVTK